MRDFISENRSQNHIADSLSSGVDPSALRGSQRSSYSLQDMDVNSTNQSIFRAGEKQFSLLKERSCTTQREADGRRSYDNNPFSNRKMFVSQRLSYEGGFRGSFGMRGREDKGSQRSETTAVDSHHWQKYSSNSMQRRLEDKTVIPNRMSLGEGKGVEVMSGRKRDFTQGVSSTEFLFEQSGWKENYTYDIDNNSNQRDKSSSRGTLFEDKNSCENISFSATILKNHLGFSSEEHGRTSSAALHSMVPPSLSSGHLCERKTERDVIETTTSITSGGARFFQTCVGGDELIAFEVPHNNNNNNIIICNSCTQNKHNIHLQTNERELACSEEARRDEEGGALGAVVDIADSGSACLSLTEEGTTKEGVHNSHSEEECYLHGDFAELLMTKHDENDNVSYEYHNSNTNHHSAEKKRRDTEDIMAGISSIIVKLDGNQGDKEKVQKLDEETVYEHQDHQQTSTVIDIADSEGISSIFFHFSSEDNDNDDNVINTQYNNNKSDGKIDIDLCRPSLKRVRGGDNALKVTEKVCSLKKEGKVCHESFLLNAIEEKDSMKTEKRCGQDFHIKRVTISSLTAANSTVKTSSSLSHLQLENVVHHDLKEEKSPARPLAPVTPTRPHPTASQLAYFMSLFSGGVCNLAYNALPSYAYRGLEYSLVLFFVCEFLRHQRRPFLLGLSEVNLVSLDQLSWSKHPIPEQLLNNLRMFCQFAMSIKEDECPIRVQEKEGAETKGENEESVHTENKLHESGNANHVDDHYHNHYDNSNRKGSAHNFLMTSNETQEEDALTVILARNNIQPTVNDSVVTFGTIPDNNKDNNPNGVSTTTTLSPPKASPLSALFVVNPTQLLDQPENVLFHLVVQEWLWCFFIRHGGYFENSLPYSRIVTDLRLKYSPAGLRGMIITKGNREGPEEAAGIAGGRTLLTTVLQRQLHKTYQTVINERIEKEAIKEKNSAVASFTASVSSSSVSAKGQQPSLSGTKFSKLPSCATRPHRVFGNKGIASCATAVDGGSLLGRKKNLQGSVAPPWPHKPVIPPFLEREKLPLSLSLQRESGVPSQLRKLVQLELRNQELKKAIETAFEVFDQTSLCVSEVESATMGDGFFGELAAIVGSNSFARDRIGFIFATENKNNINCNGSCCSSYDGDDRDNRCANGLNPDADLFDPSTSSVGTCGRNGGKVGMMMPFAAKSIASDFNAVASVLLDTKKDEGGNKPPQDNSTGGGPNFRIIEDSWRSRCPDIFSLHKR